MSKELESWKLEQTIISQAYEIVCLKRDKNYMTDKFDEAEKKYQVEKDRADRYGGLIHTIGQILNDEELSHEEQVTTIQTLVNQWKEQEKNE